ncbi:MAG: hypothetical protein IJA03_08720 [Bacteroidaceae bacterium]|nr:hypothetical protein [Bacteroidaceae bacterium]
MEKMKAKEDIAYDQFKEMEKRYHTWMNYYSLFNGALLVAYCTILVSTGQVIEMGGGISTENGITGNARLFQLECTYWNILSLIAVLGCVASYCWYLSAIGHYHWIGRWRKVLMKQENYPKLDFRDVEICNFTNRAMHYHSTFKITKFFIFIVLLSWIFVCYSSITIDNFQVDCCKIIKVSCIGIGLCLSELLMHLFVGSDFSIFNQKTKGDKDHFLLFLLNIWCKIKETLLIFCFIILLVVALNICQYG